MNINIYAPITCGTSYGSVARNLVDALVRLGHTVWTHNIQGNQISYALWEEETVGQSLRDAYLYDPKAPCLKIFHANDLRSSIGSGKKVSFPIFELDTFTSDEISQLSKQDALIVASNWAKRVVQQNNVSTTCFVSPLGVDRAIFNEDVVPSDNDILKDNALKLLFIGKWEIRKAVPEVIHAFEKAFTDTDDVVLIFNSYNHFISKQRNDDWAIFCKTSKLGSKIHVLENYLSTQKNVANLIASVDIGVCLSRAEGWDMPAHEFLSMGKHVIASNVTAHTEFLNANNAMIVDYTETERAEDGVFFAGQGNWAKIGEKEINEIASSMKMLYNLKRDGRLGVNQTGIETAKRFSWENCANKVLEALQ